MDSIFGIVGKDFVLLAADCKVVRSILVYKDDEDKVRSLMRLSRSNSLSTLRKTRQLYYLTLYFILSVNFYYVIFNIKIFSPLT